jgi:hypothetical protein
MKMRKEWENSYMDVDPDILIMITDQKLEEFLNKIQEELKKRIATDPSDSTLSRNKE